MNLLILFVVSFPLGLLVGVVVSAITAFCHTWVEWGEKRNKRKWYDVRIRVYKRLATEETNPIEKAYWTAKLCNCEYEINRLEKGE